MSRVAHVWRAMEPEQRLASVASVALLVTMFFPWYGLQSLNRKTGAISSHTINAFGDVSFVEAAVFLVAAAVIVMLVARVEGRNFHLPGGDGTIVMIAGGWAALLIFYRVFSRPAGDGYPVGIEWGFFLAFVAAGGLTYAGWRMRNVERPEPPATRRPPRQPPPARERRRPPENPDDTNVTALVGASQRPRPARSAPVPAEPRPEPARPRYPPAPSRSRPPSAEAEQLSFEDSSAEGDRE
ncbi:MAG TPA: hypothetical protein VNZ01_10930 [Solirubrobacteraceae bacterium]|jgi:hypothetical protein|nr:hypothetical protein [Solirubrobacteraceae bacterium]